MLRSKTINYVILFSFLFYGALNVKFLIKYGISTKPILILTICLATVIITLYNLLQIKISESNQTFHKVFKDLKPKKVLRRLGCVLFGHKVNNNPSHKWCGRCVLAYEELYYPLDYFKANLHVKAFVTHSVTEELMFTDKLPTNEILKVISYIDVEAYFKRYEDFTCFISLDDGSLVLRFSIDELLFIEFTFRGYKYSVSTESRQPYYYKYSFDNRVIIEKEYNSLVRLEPPYDKSYGEPNPKQEKQDLKDYLNSLN